MNGKWEGINMLPPLCKANSFFNRKDHKDHKEDPTALERSGILPASGKKEHPTHVSHEDAEEGKRLQGKRLF